MSSSSAVEEAEELVAAMRQKTLQLAQQQRESDAELMRKHQREASEKYGKGRRRRYEADEEETYLEEAEARKQKRREGKQQQKRKKNEEKKAKKNEREKQGKKKQEVEEPQNRKKVPDEKKPRTEKLQQKKNKKRNKRNREELAEEAENEENEESEEEQNNDYLSAVPEASSTQLENESSVLLVRPMVNEEDKAADSIGQKPVKADEDMTDEEKRAKEMQEALAMLHGETVGDNIAMVTFDESTRDLFASSGNADSPRTSPAELDISVHVYRGRKNADAYEDYDTADPTQPAVAPLDLTKEVGADATDEEKRAKEMANALGMLQKDEAKVVDGSILDCGSAMDEPPSFQSIQDKTPSAAADWLKKGNQADNVALLEEEKDDKKDKPSRSQPEVNQVRRGGEAQAAGTLQPQAISGVKVDQIPKADSEKCHVVSPPTKAPADPAEDDDSSTVPECDDYSTDEEMVSSDSAGHSAVQRQPETLKVAIQAAIDWLRTNDPILDKVDLVTLAAVKRLTGTSLPKKARLTKKQKKKIMKDVLKWITDHKASVSGVKNIKDTTIAALRGLAGLSVPVQGFSGLPHNQRAKSLQEALKLLAKRKAGELGRTANEAAVFALTELTGVALPNGEPTKAIKRKKVKTAVGWLRSNTNKPNLDDVDHLMLYAIQNIVQAASAPRSQADAKAAKAVKDSSSGKIRISTAKPPKKAARADPAYNEDDTDPVSDDDDTDKEMVALSSPVRSGHRRRGALKVAMREAIDWLQKNDPNLGNVDLVTVVAVTKLTGTPAPQKARLKRKEKKKILKRVWKRMATRSSLPGINKNIKDTEVAALRSLADLPMPADGPGSLHGSDRVKASKEALKLLAKKKPKDLVKSADEATVFALATLAGVALPNGEPTKAIKRKKMQVAISWLRDENNEPDLDSVDELMLAAFADLV